jgi:hypothetical protein
MSLWLGLLILGAIAIGTEFILRIVKISTRHAENIERIKHGYPTLDGAKPEPHTEEVNYMERLQ